MITTICMLARDQDLRITRIPTVANGNVKTVEIDVKTDQMWEGLSLSAVFFNSEKGPVYEILLTNGKCTVPHEVLEKKTTLHIGLRGTAPDQKKVSTLVTYDIKKGAPESNATAEGPTPDVYQQILKRLDEINFGVSDERIEKAVRKYLENNPVNVVVDDALLEESENPVQNKVITKEIRELSEQIEDLDNYATPEMFGAIGDGVTDDTEAIQSAIESNNLILFKNDYLISDTLVVGSDKTLVFLGKMILNSVENDNYKRFFNFNNSANVKIYGGEFLSKRDKVGKAPAGHTRKNILSSNVGLFIATNNVSNISLYNVRTNYLETSHFRNSTGLYVYNCVFENCNTFLYCDYATDIIFENTTISLATELGTGDHCLYFGEDVRNLSITGCDFWGDSYAGELVDLSYGAKTSLLPPTDIVIDGCTFTGPLGIVDYATNLKVYNSAFECDRLVTIAGDAETVFHNCTIDTYRLIASQTDLECHKRLKFVNCEINMEVNAVNSEYFSPVLEFEGCKISTNEFASFNSMVGIIIKNSTVVCSSIFVALRKQSLLYIENSNITCTIFLSNDNSLDMSENVILRFSTINHSSYFVYPTKADSVTRVSCYNGNHELLDTKSSARTLLPPSPVPEAQSIKEYALALSSGTYNIIVPVSASWTDLPIYNNRNVDGMAEVIVRYNERYIRIQKGYGVWSIHYTGSTWSEWALAGSGSAGGSQVLPSQSVDPQSIKDYALSLEDGRYLSLVTLNSSWTDLPDSAYAYSSTAEIIVRYNERLIRISTPGVGHMWQASYFGDKWSDWTRTTLYSELPDFSEFVKSVNGEIPDENGNVKLSTGGANDSPILPSQSVDPQSIKDYALSLEDGRYLSLVTLSSGWTDLPGGAHTYSGTAEIFVRHSERLIRISTPGVDYIWQASYFGDKWSDWKRMALYSEVEAILTRLEALEERMANL